ncbi:DUF4322 domain-containing protein [Saccharolobus islandicus]|uniref:DUF4322 domain-containing protein n=1 Tax=Saccharolobus islandicus TaxID=43080 RepID=UPI003D7C688B
MTTPDYISPKIRVQIEEKLFSIINFKGRKAEEVKKTLLLRGNPRKTRERIKPSITREKEINK